MELYVEANVFRQDFECRMNLDPCSNVDVVLSDRNDSSLTMEEMNEMFDLSLENEEVSHPDLDKTLQNINDFNDDQKELEESMESVHNNSLKMFDEEYNEPDDNEEDGTSSAKTNNDTR